MSLIKEGCSFGDIKKFWNFIKIVMDEDLKVFWVNMVEEVCNIVDMVLNVVKVVCDVKC